MSTIHNIEEAMEEVKNVTIKTEPIGSRESFSKLLWEKKWKEEHADRPEGRQKKRQMERDWEKYVSKKV